MPFIVCGLIGIAIDGITNGTLIELIASPDSPNLYWALTVLPRPFFDFEPALQEEGVMLENMWPALKRLENGPMTPGHPPG